MLNDDALTTHDAAEAWLTRQGQQVTGETEDDLVIDILINFASRAIQNETGNFRPREGSAATPVVKRFAYDGSGLLSLFPYRLDELATSGIIVGSDLPTTDQWTLLAQTGTQESDYRLEPRARDTAGTYDAVILPRRRMASSWSMTEWEVSVSGVWGTDQVPGDIEMLCLEIVRLSYPGIQAVTPGEELGIAPLTWLPRQLMDILNVYRPRSF